MFLFGIAIAAGVLSSALIILASPSYGMWELGLLAVAPVYYLRLVSRKGVTVLATIIFAASFAFHNGAWYFTFLDEKPVVAALACLVFFLIYGWAVETAVTVGRRRPSLAPLALPVIWVAVDAVRTSVSWLEWAWFPLYANTQVGNVPFLQLASWGGVHLVTFAALAVGAAVAYWLTGPFKPFRAAWALILLAIYGALWLSGRGAAEALGDASALTITCVQTGAIRDDSYYDILEGRIGAKGTTPSAAFPGPATGFPGVAPGYFDLTDEALKENPDVDVAVWTETMFCAYDDAETRAKIAYFAWSRGIYVVFDCYENARDARYNTAVMLDGNGREVLKWRKRYPAPGEPSDRPPNDEPYGVYNAPWGPTGILICYDDHFPRVARGLAVEGARVFLIPSNDHGFGDDYFYRIHLNDAVFRAVENRCATAVAAYDGYSAIIDDAGRVVAMKDDHDAGWITAKVNAGRGGAFYTKHPWVSFWLYVGAAVVVLLGGATGRDRLGEKKKGEERKKHKWWE